MDLVTFQSMTLQRSCSCIQLRKMLTSGQKMSFNRSLTPVLNFVASMQTSRVEVVTTQSLSRSISVGQLPLLEAMHHRNFVPEQHESFGATSAMAIGPVLAKKVIQQCWPSIVPRI